MKQGIVACVTGIMMGLGLGISQMINPAKVIGFLDVGGVWDPTLAFVMAGALGVTFVLFRFILKCDKPFCSQEFSLPKRTDVDLRLGLGAVLFGIGWGLSGFCPAPAIASLAYGLWPSVTFVAAMLLGMAIYQRFKI